MAKPIGVTPVLTGNDARKFLSKIQAEEQKRVGPTPTPKLAKEEALIREHGKGKSKHVR